jgi:hypothetical protein
MLSPELLATLMHAESWVEHENNSKRSNHFLSGSPVRTSIGQNRQEEFPKRKHMARSDLEFELLLI